MATHAAHIAEQVLRLEARELDYTVDSLAIVDEILGKFHDAGDDPERMAETLFRFGAYIGEVIVRIMGGSWVRLADEHPLGGAGWPVVRLGSEHFVNPIGKAYKRVQHGGAESITYFYHALVQR
jgi:hypothetical protein